MIAALLMTLATATALALTDDRLQAIEITAERAERDERRGYTVYSGAVVLTQGSLRIEAERLTIYHDREAADRIIATGEPARLRQRPALDKAFVVAEGERIVYERSRELVILRGGASIEQDGAVVTGESIRYLMAEQVVRADATPDDDGDRVQVFIPAEVVEAASEEDSRSDTEGGSGPPASTPTAETGEKPAEGADGDPDLSTSGERAEGSGRGTTGSP